MHKRCYNTGEALHYLGIKRRSFEAHILPSLRGKGIRIGNCIVFEREDLDIAWESFKLSLGSEGLRSGAKGALWNAENKSGYSRQNMGILSTDDTKDSAYAAAASKLLQKRKTG